MGEGLIIFTVKSNGEIKQHDHEHEIDFAELFHNTASRLSTKNFDGEIYVGAMSATSIHPDKNRIATRYVKGVMERGKKEDVYGPMFVIARNNSVPHTQKSMELEQEYQCYQYYFPEPSNHTPIESMLGIKNITGSADKRVDRIVDALQIVQVANERGCYVSPKQLCLLEEVQRASSLLIKDIKSD